MSLIVAKKFGDKICVVSDTRIDNPENLNRVDLDVPEVYGLIKTIVINPFICVAFAGEIELVNAALNVCKQLNHKVDEIVQHLLSVNKNSKNKAEFIVCVAAPPFLIYKISNYEVEKTDSTWIGYVEGFNEFQKNYNAKGLNQIRLDPISDMENAMTAVIESQVLGVNGFMIEVTNERWSFLYKNYIKTYIPPRTFIGGGFHVIGYGTAEEGGYTIHILESERTDVLAIHVPQNRMGIIYAERDSEMLTPEVFRDVDEHEFIEITNSSYNIKPGYKISSLQKSYFERGNKAAELRQFENAIYYYGMGLKENEISLKADLYFNIGVCQIHLRKFNEGTDNFNKAVKLNSNLQPKVFQFMARFRAKP
jgi:hypothetical protein